MSETTGHRAMGWAEPGSDRPPGRGEILAWVALIALVTASRWAVAPSGLYDWDAANYALAIRDLDVYEHQPHAPGSPIFVLLLKLASLVGGSPATPFLLVNGVLGAAALVGLGAMVRRTVGPAAALGVAATIAVAPQLWHHGAASTAYVAEAACSIGAATTALALARGRLAPALAGVVLGVVVGVRPNTALTLLPVAAVGLVLARPRLRDGGLALGAFAATTAAWLVPLIGYGGGWSRFRSASGSLANWQLAAGSAFGGGLDEITTNGRRLALYLFDGGNLLWPLLALDLAIGGLALLTTSRDRRGSPWPAARSLLLLTAWTAPASLLYAVHHLPKSGYVLTLLPAVFVAVTLAASAAMRAVRPRLRPAVVGLNVAGFAAFALLNASTFLFSVPAEWLKRRDAEIALPSLLLGTSDYGAATLAYRTWPHERVREAIEQLDPERDLALFLYGSHELYRVAMVHHPDRWLVATSIDHASWTSTRGPAPFDGSAASVAGSSAASAPDGAREPTKRGDDGLEPAGPAGPLTFGAFQSRLLDHPIRSRDWEEPTRVGIDGSVLHLERNGAALRIALDRVPRAVLVLVPCPPCDAELGPGVSEAALVEVGGGYGATRLRTLGISD